MCLVMLSNVEEQDHQAQVQLLEVSVSIAPRMDDLSFGITIELLSSTRLT
jgi:hypothetical protein